MTPAKSNQLVHLRSSNDSFDLRHYFKAKIVTRPNNHQMPRPSKPPKNVRLWTGTRIRSGRLANAKSIASNPSAACNVSYPLPSKISFTGLKQRVGESRVDLMTYGQTPCS